AFLVQHSKLTRPSSYKAFSFDSMNLATSSLRYYLRRRSFQAHRPRLAQLGLLARSSANSLLTISSDLPFAPWRHPNYLAPYRRIISDTNRSKNNTRSLQ